MNLDTSDLRLKRRTVSFSTRFLKRLQDAADRRMAQLRKGGKIRRAATPVAPFALAAWFLGAPGGARAVTSFTEPFGTGNSDWGNASSLPIGWVAAGGSDGGGYITTTAAFDSIGQGVVFRAHDEFFLPTPAGSSGNAFAGNWIADGVVQFSVDVRHNVPTPVTFFTRFASPHNFPGAIATSFVPVQPDTWTTVTFAISPANPGFVSFEGSDFNSVFANIGHLQVGPNTPAGFATSSTPYTFDLDLASVTVAPEPSAALLLLSGAALGLARRRKASLPHTTRR